MLVGNLEAITKSRQLMDGHKKRLLLTILSFWPWVVIPFIGATVYAVMFQHFLNFNEIFNEIATGTGTFSFWITTPLRFIMPFYSYGNTIMALLIGAYSLVFLFYLMPYYQTTMAGFYRELVQKGEIN